jgi:hypothetical protein
LFVGPDKAGSSWLHAILAQHPEAYITPAKDLYFFDQYFERGIDWYSSRFRNATGADKVVGEICHGYLLSSVAAKRISDTLPEVRIMACLRDPVDRIRSWYLHWQKHGLLSVDIESAIRMRPRTVEAGAYWTQLERYRAAIGRHRMYVAVFDDLRENPQSFLDGLTDWLGVSRLPLSEAELAPRRQASKPRNAPVARLVKRTAIMARGARLDAMVGRIKNSQSVERALYKAGAPVGFAMPQDVVQMIHARLYDEVRKCEQEYELDLLNRWGWV